MPDTKAVTKKPKNDVIDYSEYEENADMGFEDTTKDAFAVPRLVVLHKQSPQCEPTNSKHVVGAQQGKIFNTVTSEIFDEIIVVPVHYIQKFLEWAPRDSGGGFCGEHQQIPTNAEIKENDIFPTVPNGNEIRDTRNHAVLQVHGNGTFEPVIISMSSVQIKKSKSWNTMMRNLKGLDKDGQFFSLPMFSHSYKVSTIPESNNKGDWAGWKIELNERVDVKSNLYKEAVLFHKSIMKKGITAVETPNDGDDIPY